MGAAHLQVKPSDPKPAVKAVLCQSHGLPGKAAACPAKPLPARPRSEFAPGFGQEGGRPSATATDLGQSPSDGQAVLVGAAPKENN